MTAKKEQAASGGEVSTTLCWNCNAAYPIAHECCPKCYAANGNVDPQKAKMQEVRNSTRIGSWTDIENYGEKFCEAFNAGVNAHHDAVLPLLTAASPSPTAPAAQQTLPETIHLSSGAYLEWDGDGCYNFMRDGVRMRHLNEFEMGFVRDTWQTAQRQQGERVAELEAELQRWAANENVQMERAIKAERELTEARRELAEVRGKAS